MGNILPGFFGPSTSPSSGSFRSAQKNSVVGSRQIDSQSALILIIIGSLQPHISGAALSSQTTASHRPTSVVAGRPAPFTAPVRSVIQTVPVQRVSLVAPVRSPVAGENFVRIET